MLTFVYYQNIFINDSIKITNSATSNVITYRLPHFNCSLVFSPNYVYAVAWDKFTRIYVYNATNFALLRIVNDSVMGASFVTDNIEFNVDSTLIIVEADNFNSVKVISLIDFNVVNSLSINTAVIGSMFISD